MADDSQELPVVSEEEDTQETHTTDMQHHIQIFTERYVDTLTISVFAQLSILELVKEFFFVYFQCLPEEVTEKDEDIFTKFKQMYVTILPVWTLEQWDKSLRNIHEDGILSSTKGMAGLTDIFDISMEHAAHPFSSDLFRTEAKTGKNEMQELWNYEQNYNNDDSHSIHFAHKKLISILVGEVLRSCGQIQRSNRMAIQLLEKYRGDTVTENFCKMTIQNGQTINARMDLIMDSATRFAFMVKHDVSDELTVSSEKKSWLREGKILFCDALGLTINADNDLSLDKVIPKESGDIPSPWHILGEVKQVFPAIVAYGNIYYASQGFILFIVNKLRYHNMWDGHNGNSVIDSLHSYYEVFNKTASSWDTRLSERRTLHRGGSAGGGPGGGGGGNGNQMGGGGGGRAGAASGGYQGRPGAASGGYQGDRRRAGAGPQAYQSRAGGARRNTRDEWIRGIEEKERKGFRNKNYKGKNYKPIRELLIHQASRNNEGSATSDSGSDSGSESASPRTQCPFCEWTTSDRNPLHALTVHMRQKANEARTMYEDKANEVDMHAKFESLQGLENDLTLQEVLAARDHALADVPAYPPNTRGDDFPALPGQETSGSGTNTIACPFCTWTYTGVDSMPQWFLHMRNKIKTARELLDMKANDTEPHAMYEYQYGLDETDLNTLYEAGNSAPGILRQVEEETSLESSVPP